MFALAMITLVVALAASVWTTAYALTAAVPDLLWLDRVRRTNAWWDTVEDMQVTLARWRELEP